MQENGQQNFNLWSRLKAQLIHHSRLPKPAASASSDCQLPRSHPGGEALPTSPAPGSPAWQLSPLGREAARETPKPAVLSSSAVGFHTGRVTTDLGAGLNRRPRSSKARVTLRPPALRAAPWRVSPAPFQWPWPRAPGSHRRAMGDKGRTLEM